MGVIRFLRLDDVPQVLELYDKVLGQPAVVADPARRRDRFLDVYFGSPLRDEEIQPLVYEEAARRITGFLGVLPQPVCFRGRHLRCAVAAHFCVNPASRGLAGVKLLTTFLTGPQDVSIADESNATSRRLWEALGGSTSLLSSLSWTIPLRPAQFGLHLARKRVAFLSRIPPLSMPIAKLLDRAAIGFRRFSSQDEGGVIGQGLDHATLLRCQAELQDERLLLPCYTEDSLKWRLERLAAMKRYGDLQGIILRSANGETAGWYLYCLKPGGVAPLLQLVFRAAHGEAVLRHLLNHARRGGAIGLTGQITADLYTPLFERFCLIRHSCWTLTHSRDSELRDAFCRGESRLSRVEGEWCQRLE